MIIPNTLTNEFREDVTSPTNSPQQINSVTADADSQQRSVVANPTQPNNKLINKKNMEKENITSCKELKSVVEAIVILLGDKVQKKTRIILDSYLAAKKSGLKVAFLGINRKVNKLQVQALFKSINGKGKFSSPCLVVPLKPILKSFPDLEVFDGDGNQVTLDIPELEKYVVVYDGQHRITACELKPEAVDVELELMDFDGENPLETIKLMNTCSRNWSCEDLKRSNVSAGISTNKLYEQSEILQYRYGITPKLAEYILTFNREATKKKDLVRGKETTIYEEENASRGKEIYSAAFMTFNGAKEVKKLQFMDAIVDTYNKVTDSNKPRFRQYMKLYLGTMRKADSKKILSFFEEKNFGDLEVFVKTGYETFIETHDDESQLKEMETELDSRIKSFIENLEKKNQEKFEKTELKGGRVHEILAQHRKVEDKRKEAAQQKAKDKRDRAKVAVEKAKSKAERASREFQSLQNIDIDSDNDSTENK